MHARVCVRQKQVFDGDLCEKKKKKSCLIVVLDLYLHARKQRYKLASWAIFNLFIKKK